MTVRIGSAVALVATAVLLGGSVLVATRSAFGLRADMMPATTARTHVIEIQEFRFEPHALRVAAGDTIRWINRDPVAHTVTANDSTWDSGRIAAGAEWRWVAVRGGGPDYYCVYHPIMKGMLEVGASLE